MDDLDKILMGGSKQDCEQSVIPVKSDLAALPLEPLSDKLTVMGLHNRPVIVEDPVRFRKDIGTMVMSQMMRGMPTKDEIEVIEATGSMIEIATVRQLVKAACGDLDSYKVMMDRVLGKAVNQTKSVSMVVSYEQVISELDPEEIIEPERVFNLDDEVNL